jgi:hypothetical protein
VPGIPRPKGTGRTEAEGLFACPCFVRGDPGLDLDLALDA